MIVVCEVCTGKHPTNFCDTARRRAGIEPVSRTERHTIEPPRWDETVYQRERERLKKARWRANVRAARSPHRSPSNAATSPAVR